MTPEELAEIKARAEAATPGPWEDTIDGIVTPGGIPLLNYTHDEDGAGDWHIDGAEFSAADTEFIIHAREDVPALIAEVERLNKEHEDEVYRFNRFFRVHEERKTQLAAIRKAGLAVLKETEGYDFKTLRALAEAIKEESE